MQTYIVQVGDTLFGISRQFGVSMEEIKNINNLTENTITPGEVLKIPTTETTILYTVKKGDNLYTIANTYNTTVEELIRINDLKTNALFIGQQLRIPIESNLETNNSITYTVKAGDNLYEIANSYNTTVDAIKSLNQLSSNLLSVGQQLKIPMPNNTTNTTTQEYQDYIVASGDNLYDIANQFGMSVDELMKVNNLNTTFLFIGQVLKVKKQPQSFEEIITYEECYGEGYKPPTYQTYTVKRGDSLYTIANQFNTTIEQLVALNNLTSDNLSIGQILKIKEVSQ